MSVDGSVKATRCQLMALSRRLDVKTTRCQSMALSKRLDVS